MYFPRWVVVMVSLPLTLGGDDVEWLLLLTVLVGGNKGTKWEREENKKKET